MHFFDSFWTCEGADAFASGQNLPKVLLTAEFFLMSGKTATLVIF